MNAIGGTQQLLFFSDRVSFPIFGFTGLSILNLWKLLQTKFLKFGHDCNGYKEKKISSRFLRGGSQKEGKKRVGNEMIGLGKMFFLVCPLDSHPLSSVNLG